MMMMTMIKKKKNEEDDMQMEINDQRVRINALSQCQPSHTDQASLFTKALKLLIQYLFYHMRQKNFERI